MFIVVLMKYDLVQCLMVLQLTTICQFLFAAALYKKWKLCVCSVCSGTSKKKAKHNAAISLLNQMGVLPALVNGQSSEANGLVF